MRRHGDALRELAARYGISNLRFASPGRIVGTVADDRDALDTADFEIAARALLGAEVGLFSRSRARQAKRQSGPGRCASAVKSDDVRADRHALLELDAILAQIETFAAGASRQRFRS